MLREFRSFLDFAFRRRPLLTAALLIVVTLAVFFGLRLGAATLFLSHREESARQLQPWMSPRLVARAWSLDRDTVLSILGVDPGTDPRRWPKTIRDVSRETGLTLAEIQARIEMASDLLRRGGGE